VAQARYRMESRVGSREKEKGKGKGKGKGKQRCGGAMAALSARSGHRLSGLKHPK